MSKHVEFISYTGEYPCLCSGVLTLRIDNEIYTFGEKFIHGGKGEYPKFWTSGGGVWFDGSWEGHVDEGRWRIDTIKLPERFRQFAEEIAQVFNDNVEWGCCGGCI